MHNNLSASFVVVFFLAKLFIAMNSKMSFFIGVDISKDTLDFAVTNAGGLLFHQVISNGTTEIKQFFSELKQVKGFKLSKALVCMEHTGFYANVLLDFLAKKKANVLLENPLKIKKSAGLARGKSDKADAVLIAQYAYQIREDYHLWRPKRDVVEALAQLAALRTRLIMVREVLMKPIAEQEGFIKAVFHTDTKGHCQGSVEVIKADIMAIDGRILEVVESDERLRRLMEVVCSVPQIGKVTALQMIISTNEFLTISCPKKFACYAGIAPYPNESGTVTRRRKVSAIANKRMKALLHICAMGACRNVPDIRAYYLRKVAEGKPKMLVLNAIRVKLVNRVFACVKENRLYTAEYKKLAVDVQPVNVEEPEEVLTES